MKKNILILFILCFTVLTAQEKYITKSGNIHFEASVPSFEPVEATHTNVSAILKEDGSFAALALVTGFRFKIALMEEHFNENFAESSKYPKITFKGKITDFILENLTEEEKEYIISGTFSMHGTEKTMDVPALLKKENGSIIINSSFAVKPEDFNIEIPSVVSKKIAEEINVSVMLNLK